MIQLSNDNVKDFICTGDEKTAQCLSSNLEELFIGVGNTAYMYERDAKALLSDDEFNTSVSHPENKNNLFVHLDSAILFHLLRREDFVITD